jgi:hypothetical protein
MDSKFKPPSAKPETGLGTGRRRPEVLGLGARADALRSVGRSLTVHGGAFGFDLRVDDGFDSVAPTRRAVPPGCGLLGVAACGLWRPVSGSGRCSGGEVLPRLARPTPGRRLRIQPRAGEDLLDHRLLEDGRYELALHCAADGAVLEVYLVDTLEQPR